VIGERRSQDTATPPTPRSTDRSANHIFSFYLDQESPRCLPSLSFVPSTLPSLGLWDVLPPLSSPASVPRKLSQQETGVTSQADVR
jgi:hypothetical protein